MTTVSEQADNNHPDHNDPGQDDADTDLVEPAGLGGPVTTLQGTVGVLAALSLILAAVAGEVTVALTAFGVVAVVPLALGAISRTVGRRGRRTKQSQRDEDAAIVLPVAALSWQPVVVLSDLREQIFHGGAMAVAAGVIAVALAVCCARRPTR
jgi:peptidoglycan/LPS O-acetylase OafA/YrhL